MHFDASVGAIGILEIVVGSEHHWVWRWLRVKVDHR